MDGKFLPIGSVVLLKNTSKKIMVIGYCPVTTDNVSYDYVGSLWPEGILDSDKTLFFNHSDIDNIVVKGFDNEESKELNTKLNEALKKYKEEKEEVLV